LSTEKPFDAEEDVDEQDNEDQGSNDDSELEQAKASSE